MSDEKVQCYYLISYITLKILIPYVKPVLEDEATETYCGSNV
jgi:hypothetical protein